MSDDALLRRVSHSMFWNAALLPLISGLNLAAAVLIRRYFGLESGLYDVLLGLLNTALFYSALGIPVSFTQFLPTIESQATRGAAIRFLRRAGITRLTLAAVTLIPLNLFAGDVAARMYLGADGVVLIRLVSLLVLIRAGNELLVRALQSLLAHLQANLLQMLQAASIAIAIGWTFAGGHGMVAVFEALVVVGVLVGIAGTFLLRGRLARIPARRERTWSPISDRAFWAFALFMYAFELSNYFAMPAFASTALGMISADRAPLAFFNTAFQIPMMVVVVVLSSFQGVYRPLFARLLGDGRPDSLRTAFAEVSKVQAVLLIPAGVGLMLLLPQIIPLLFGAEFAPAVSLARWLCVGLFLEATLNLGTIILSVDHRYRDVMLAQALRIAAAPAFVALAAAGRLEAATAVFAGGRVAAVVVGYGLARRRYGCRLPLPFVARLSLPTAAMAIAVVVAGSFSVPGWLPVIGAIVLGAAVMALGLRVFRVVGPRELELLERARLPGRSLIIAWLRRD